VQKSETQAVARIEVRSFRAEAIKALKDGVRLEATVDIDTVAHANNSFDISGSGCVFCEATDV